MSKTFKAAVIGGSGYGGAEMIRRLLIHPEVELVRVSSIDFVGQPLWAAHPNLTGRTELCFEDLTPTQAAQGCDVVLLALPHKVTALKVPELAELGVKIVDMSGDFRLDDPAVYAEYYGQPHPRPDLLAEFVYGLPELQRDRIRQARFVAAPGCFATAMELPLLPLARAGLLKGRIFVSGITGSSGSGAAPSAGTHHPVRSVNMRAYSPLKHRHQPEVEMALRYGGGQDFEICFVPVSGTVSRGILATLFLELPAEVTAETLAALYDETFAGHPFVRRPKGRLPEVAAVAGSNFAEVGFALGQAKGGTRPVTVMSAIDNLIKGGAGQAIQCMNLVLGLPEMLSLEDPGSWP